MPKKVIVIGLGVAGQTAALSLSKYGFQVSIYDKSNSVLSPLGAGVALNGGAKCLTELGYRHVWESFGEPMEELRAYGKNGSISKFRMMDALKDTSMDGHFCIIKRDDLLRNLHDEILKNPLITIYMGKKAVSFDQDETKAVVTFSDDTTDEADMIIGADGIHSSAKNYIIADSDLQSPVHTGKCVYFGVISKVPGMLPPKTGVDVELGSGALALILPLKSGEGVLAIGHEATDQYNSNSEDWNYSSTADDLHKLFLEKGFYETQNIVTEETIRSLARLSHLGIFQQQNLPKWHQGRIGIIGDAAHATSPFMGQGANQAVQDGYLIGKLLSEHDGDHDAAFKSLYLIRHPITSKIVSNSKAMGEFRTGTSYKNQLIRMVGRNVAHYAPTWLMRKILMSNLSPTFLDMNTKECK